MRTAEKQRTAGLKRSAEYVRKMDKLIDELGGSVTEGDPVGDLEREHRAEILADEHRRS